MSSSTSASEVRILCRTACSHTMTFGATIVFRLTSRPISLSTPTRFLPCCQHSVTMQPRRLFSTNCWEIITCSWVTWRILYNSSHQALNVVVYPAWAVSINITCCRPSTAHCHTYERFSLHSDDLLESYIRTPNPKDQ